MTEITSIHSVAGLLPLSEDVVRLASAGVFCVQQPDHPIADEIRRIADWSHRGPHGRCQ